MRIRDITLHDIREGKRWKLVNPGQEYDGNAVLENLSIAESDHFGPEDYVVYSAVFVTDAGVVQPRVMIKVVGSPEYAGDECELVDGAWRQVGLVPDPDAPFGNEYFANPLIDDPSFASDEEPDVRAYHQQGFGEWSTHL